MFRKIAPDKWKHFFVGILMGIVLQAFCSYLMKNNLALATTTSFVFVIVISYGFELFSKFTRIGHYDFMDAVAGAVGGLLGMGMVMAAQILF